MAERFEVSTILQAPAKMIFEAWLDSEAHSAFTGGRADVDPQVGGAYSSWDGYIQGETLEMEPYARIVQTWRTTEFPEGSPASILEILFNEGDGGTKITLHHSHIPDGQGEQYRQGWEEHYFTPMRKYFQAQR